jgi:hypothetical protein
VLSERFKIDAILPDLRDFYPDTDDGLADMKAARRTAREAATDTPITLTQSASEGASQSGVITCDPFILLQALNELIDERDPESATPRSRVVVPDYTLATPV